MKISPLTFALYAFSATGYRQRDARRSSGAGRPVKSRLIFATLTVGIDPMRHEREATA